MIPSVCAGQRLDRALAQLFPQHSRSRLQSWLRDGRIRIDDRVAGPKDKPRGGERVMVVPPLPEAVLASRPEAIPLAVVFDDDFLLVVDKPAGLVTHPGSGNPSGTLLNALLHHAPRLAELPRAGIVHRLDKDTSGLLVVARTPEAQTQLVRQLQARTVKRRYLAVVAGRVERDGLVDAAIGRHPVQRTRMAVRLGGRIARTRFRIRERYSESTLIECELETGRTHQIRVHMASIGHPLIGDRTYGAHRVGEFPRQALHAWRLGFRHPASGAQLEFESALPDDFRNLVARLRAQSAAHG